MDVFKRSALNDFPIERGEGYYLYSLSPFVNEFTIVGDCPDCETFDLLECWNLVGYESMVSTTRNAISAALISIS